MDEIASQSLGIFFSLAAFFTGLGKAGLGAIASLVMPILLMPLPGPREAVSLGTILFLIGDVGATFYYFRQAKLAVLLRLIPLGFLGMLIAFWLGKQIPEGAYLIVITVLGAAAFGMLLHSEWHKNYSELRAAGACSEQQRKRKQVLLLSAGVLAGFTTVLANTSGIFMNLYLSALSLPKRGFVATMTLYYFGVNSLKLLIYYFYWQSIDFNTVLQVWDYAFGVLASLLLGLGIGFFTVHKMSERAFSCFIIWASLLSFALLFWRCLEYFEQV